MGKIEVTLKSEIIRLARKELRPMLSPLTKQLRDLSRQVRALSSETQRLSRMTRKLESSGPAPAQPAGELTVSDSELTASRMSPGLVKKLRGRHKITQQQLAELVGVSAAAVQSWEQGIARPIGDNRTALVALRKMSTSEVAKLMADKGIAKAKRRPRTAVQQAGAAATAPAAEAPPKAKLAKTSAKKGSVRKKMAAKKATSAKTTRPKTAKKAKAAKKAKTARKASTASRRAR